MIKKIPVEKAVGHVIPHDLTKIIPGGFKGPAFKKGRLIRPEDVPHLLDIGKSHINVIEMRADEIHEDEAVTGLAGLVAGPGTRADACSEGRVNIRADREGLLKINRRAVDAINRIPNAILSASHQHRLVAPGDLLAAVKVVPLVVKKSLLARAGKVAREAGPIVAVKPIERKPLGLVIVAGEVFSGRIQDRFGPVLRAKAAHYRLPIVGESVAPDDVKMILAAIMERIEAGAKIVVAAGGMSVDADDLTPTAIRRTGAKVVTYGSPVLPGGMFMLAYLGDTAIIGLPACGMSAKNTVMDIVMPRLLADERLEKRDFAELGYGGLCLACPECRFPVCPFGKR